LLVVVVLVCCCCHGCLIGDIVSPYRFFHLSGRTGRKSDEERLYLPPDIHDNNNTPSQQQHTKTTEGARRQGVTRQGKTRHQRSKQDKYRQEKARPDEERKTRIGKVRQGK
jgi:hypothetical protein